ncbi:hypothetical protein [Camelimonas lactis]|uniref:DUF551 domain-containing protein n=1 Tax=Camelimonas lactis TaxID=659006 RepID=A0A4R2GWN1_9HYPH|nr:hypothetical protein [Camelimonas lactis]TCO15204.1 hypothetical protein EV666_102182 [Camelimonas lactis]
MTDALDLITVGLANAEAVAAHEARSAEWLSGYRAALKGLKTNYQALQITSRRPIETAPKDGTRLLLIWKPFSWVSEHVELGKWKGDLGWCNTYGHPFSSPPAFWMPLPVAAAEGRA